MGDDGEYSIDLGITAQEGAIFSEEKNDIDPYCNGKYDEDDEDDIIVVQSAVRRKLATEKVKDEISSLWRKRWVYKIPEGEEGMWLSERYDTKAEGDIESKDEESYDNINKVENEVLKKEGSKFSSRKETENEEGQLLRLFVPHYRYYNIRSGECRSDPPNLYKDPHNTAEAHFAITKLQSLYRRSKARQNLLQLRINLYTKHYDDETGRFFYRNNVTGETQWEKPKIWNILSLGDPVDDVSLDSVDQIILEKDLRIKELTNALAVKENELQEVKHHKVGEVDFIMREEAVRAARESGADKRTLDMDLWTVDELCAWFIEQGFEEYSDAIHKNRIDGYVCLHLAEDDWPDIGMNNKVHIRRLELALDQYRDRFALKQAGKKEDIEDDVSEPDDGLTETVNIADILARHQSAVIEQSTLEEDPEPEEPDDDEIPEIETLPTEEELNAAKRDAENTSVEVITEGTKNKIPLPGDIVKVHYSLFLINDGMKLVESSRSMRGKPFEFVLGLNQVCKCWEVSLKNATKGSRLKITSTPLYAYGSKGAPPKIPPDSPVMFDIEILDYRKRGIWEKKFIQEPGLSERVYEISDEDKEHDFFLQQLNTTIGELKNLQKKGGMEQGTKVNGPAGAIVTPAGIEDESMISSQANFTATSSLSK